jgi:hypothetical protein
MGQKLYGTLSGTGGNGQIFTTPVGTTSQVNSIVALQAIQTAALQLEAAVSTSLTLSGTAAAAPVAAAGWMSGSKLAALSATYATVTSSIY